jgi:hypothetical protein
VRLPALRALLFQLIAAIIVLGLMAAWPHLGLAALPLPAWAALQGTIAALLAWRAAMAGWWLPIHLLFVPALLVMRAPDVSPTWFLGGFVLLWLVHGATYRTQVPTHLSRRVVINQVARLLPQQPGLRVLDLGCGFGGVLHALARLRPEANYHGVEAAVLPFLVGWLRCRLLGGGRITNAWGDLWNVDLQAYDVVYAYLSPAAMPRLWAKAQGEMRAGCLLISNSFAIPGIAPDMSIEIAQGTGATLHVWSIMGGAKCR